MKKRKFLLVLLLAASLFFGNSLYAQPGGGPGGHGKPSDEQIKERVKELAETVGLSDDQIEKIIEIQKEHFDSMNKARQSASTDRSKKRETMDKLYEKMNIKIKAVMTDEQYKKYEEFEKSHRRGRRGNGEPPGRN